PKAGARTDGARPPGPHGENSRSADSPGGWGGKNPRKKAPSRRSSGNGPRRGRRSRAPARGAGGRRLSPRRGVLEFRANASGERAASAMSANDDAVSAAPEGRPPAVLQLVPRLGSGGAERG